jgi:hypothetical protein
MRLLSFICLLSSTQLLPGEITEAQRSAIDRATSAKGAYTAGEDVYRVAFPRTDVTVSVDGRALHPFQGLTSWAAFTPASSGHGGGANPGDLMVMGDLVLFEDEVNPVMSVALENGLEVTALHNHFFFDSPKVMFMHIGGSGSAAKLASAVGAALEKVKAIRAASAKPGSLFGGGGTPVPATNSITAPPLDTIFGVKGQVNAGMYKISIGRPATMHGARANNQMGVNTWAAFAGSDDSAVVDGDFAMTRSEVQAVLRSLRAGGIHVVAIHNHMTHEEPQYIFLHYWGKGKAQDLARALKAAMETQGR